MSASRRASSTGASSAISTQSAPSSSSMLKISVSTSTVSSTIITTSVCGLKYVPGRFTSSSSSNVLGSAISGVLPHQVLHLPAHLGLDVQRRLSAAHPTGVARLDQLAHLGLQRRVRGRRREPSDLGVDV